MELFRHDGLARIGADARAWRPFDEHRIFLVARFGDDRVAETDIDLEANLRTVEACPDTHAKATIVAVVADRFSVYSVRKKLDAIVRKSDIANFAHSFGESVRIVLNVTGQV